MVRSSRRFSKLPKQHQAELREAALLEPAARIGHGDEPGPRRLRGRARPWLARAAVAARGAKASARTEMPQRDCNVTRVV